MMRDAKPFELPTFEVPFSISSITQPDGLFRHVMIPGMGSTSSMETSTTIHTPYDTLCNILQNSIRIWGSTEGGNMIFRRDLNYKCIIH